jgi:ribose/xylose/arabinose/galactoside ABC-type transport system permease subunit
MSSPGRLARFVTGTSRILRANPLLVVGAALIVLFALLQPNFFTGANLVNILIQASVLLIAATGMTYVILTAGIDLSVGALMFLSAAFVSAALNAGVPPVVAVLLAPALAAALGALNGIVIARFAVPAMLVTLATLQVFRGIGGHLTEQRSIVLPAEVRFLGSGDWAGIPRPVVVALVVVVVGAYVLRRTRFGMRVQALGSNPAAAANAGLPVARLLVAVYAVAGLCGGIAAMVQLGRLGAVQPTLDVGFELTVITAVVLGGTSLTGGVGGIAGTAAGALLLVVVENGLVLAGASPYIFDIVRGAVLLAAILGSGLPQRLLSSIRETGVLRPQTR